MNILRAPDFRTAAAAMQDATLLPSATATVVRDRDGQRVELRPEIGGFRHPWTPEVRWNGERWEARIAVAGFVNGFEPTVGGVSILDFPWSPLPLRQVGGEGDGIPKYFAALGARAPLTNVSISGTGGISVVEDLASEAPRRSLFAGEIFIANARPTFRPSVTVVDASGTSGVVVDYSVTYDTSTLTRVGSRSRLQLAPQFPKPIRPTWFDRLLGNWQDEGEDRQQIATIFLLSPVDATGAPDATWLPVIQQHCFWHLRYGAANESPSRPFQPIRLTTGLLGGLADLIGNQILTPINELTQKLDAALNITTPEGRFWTHA